MCSSNYAQFQRPKKLLEPFLNSLKRDSSALQKFSDHESIQSPWNSLFHDLFFIWNEPLLENGFVTFISCPANVLFWTAIVCQLHAILFFLGSACGLVMLCPQHWNWLLLSRNVTALTSNTTYVSRAASEKIRQSCICHRSWNCYGATKIQVSTVFTDPLDYHVGALLIFYFTNYILLMELLKRATSCVW